MTLPQSKGLVGRGGRQARSDSFQGSVDFKPFGRLGPKLVFRFRHPDRFRRYAAMDLCSSRPRSSREHSPGQRSGTSASTPWTCASLRNAVFSVAQCGLGAIVMCDIHEEWTRFPSGSFIVLTDLGPSL